MENEPPDSLYWATSAGGPLILLEQNLLSSWHGNAGKTPTDYDRACAVKDYIDVINAGSGKAIVLGEEPAATSWWPYPEASGGLFVRWVWADDDDRVVKAIKVFSEELWQPANLNIEVVAGPLVLFDSVCSGSDPDCLRTGCKIQLDLHSGVYSVSTANYRPNDDTWLIMHRLSLNE